MIGLACGILAGFILPIQTCLNSRLRESVGSPFLSSFFSFLGGTLFLILLGLGIDRTLFFDGGSVAGQPVWIWLGGALGVMGLTTNILLFPKLGGVQTVVIPLAGQILMGLVIDHFGLFAAAQTSLTPLRAFGGVLALAGALGAVLLGRRVRALAAGGQEDGAATLWGYRALALLAGVLMASQSAINGYLGTLVGSSLRAALYSFSVGVFLLFLIVLALRLKVRVRVPAGKTSNPWWMWCGGVLGALYVFAMAYLVPLIGAGLAVVAALTGMVAASLVVDSTGLLEAPKRPVNLKQVVSLLVMLIGVVLIRLV